MPRDVEDVVGTWIGPSKFMTTGKNQIGFLELLISKPRATVAAAATTKEVSDAPSHEKAVGKLSHSPSRLVIHPDHHDTVPGLIQLYVKNPIAQAATRDQFTPPAYQ